jgi:hypothetical protein
VIFSIKGGIRSSTARHHQPELPFASRRVKRVRYEQGAHLIERLRQRRT